MRSDWIIKTFDLLKKSRSSTSKSINTTTSVFSNYFTNNYLTQWLMPFKARNFHCLLSKILSSLSKIYGSSYNKTLRNIYPFNCLTYLSMVWKTFISRISNICAIISSSKDFDKRYFNSQTSLTINKSQSSYLKLSCR